MGGGGRKPPSKGWRRLTYVLAVLLALVVLVVVLRPSPKSGKASSSPIIEAFRAAAELAESAAEYVGLDDDDDDEEAKEQAAVIAKDLPLPTPTKFEDAADPLALGKLEEPPEVPEMNNEVVVTLAPNAEPEPQVSSNRTEKVLKDAKKGNKTKTQKKKTKYDPKRFIGIVDLIVKQPFTTTFDKCALVGSAAFMKGRKLGKEIDRYETVIRVNRMPTKPFFEDFGNRTDVLFTGLQADGFKLYSKRGMWYRSLGGSLVLCRFLQTNCPFKNLVLKGSDSMEYGQSWADRYPLGSPGWKPSRTAFPLAHQSEVINQLAYTLTHPQRPSNGFHAFVTFGLICKSLTLYGFSGSGTADGHPIKTTHNMNKEHMFYKNIAKGKAAGLGVQSKYFNYYVESLKKRGKSFKVIS